MPLEGYIRWLRSGAFAERVYRLEDDGQRWRWWMLQSIVDVRTFPGLLTNPGLEPMSEGQIVALAYVGQEWRDDLVRAAQQWQLDRQAMLAAELLVEASVEKRRFLYSRNFHSYQDRHTGYRARHLGQRFVTAYEKLDPRNKPRFLRCVAAFRPENIYVTCKGKDVTADETFWARTALPLDDVAVAYAPAGISLQLPKNGNGNSAREGCLLAIYEKHRGPLPAVLRFTDHLKQKERARLAEHKGDEAQYLDDFHRAVELAASTPFYVGENDRGWQATFEYFVKNEQNVYKVLETTRAPGTSRPRGRSPAEQMDKIQRRHKLHKGAA